MNHRQPTATAQQEHEQNETLVGAAAAGLFGLAVKAFLRDAGQTGSRAAIEKIRAGQAHVKVEVIFSKSGMSAVGSYLSHANTTGQNLFEVSLKESPGAVH